MRRELLRQDGYQVTQELDATEASHLNHRAIRSADGRHTNGRSRSQSGAAGSICGPAGSAASLHTQAQDQEEKLLALHGAYVSCVNDAVRGNRSSSRVEPGLR